MPSSELGWYEDFDPVRLRDQRPAHTGELRRLIGNVDHLADQYAQRRVGWWPISGAYFEPEIAAAELVAGTFYRCWRSVPFDLHVFGQDDAGLRSYALRTRIHGARSAGTGTITFRAVVALQDAGASYVNDTVFGDLNVNVAEASSASATHAWLSPTPSVIYLDETHVAQARRDVNVRNVPGGPTVGALWLRCTAELWAATTDVASVPRASGLLVDEYFAP